MPRKPKAMPAELPATTLQTCIVHLMRNSLDYASWKDRRGLAAAIRPIYTAASAEAAQAELDAFADGEWGRRFPTVSASWRSAWDRVIPFFAFPPAIRKIIYTTNSIENINGQLRKIIKARGHLPSDEAATKLIWLALRNITADWGRAAHDWRAAMNQLPSSTKSVLPGHLCDAQPASNTETLTGSTDSTLRSSVGQRLTQLDPTRMGHVANR